MSSMDYNEAYDALEEFVNSEEFDEYTEKFSTSEQIHPEVETFGDRAIFYIQVEDNFGDDYERRVLAEYHDGKTGPVPFEAEELEKRLQGRGEVEIDESILEPKEINFPEQKKAR